MDYDHILKHPVENLPPTMFGNNFPWTTSLHPESMYASGNETRSFIKPPHSSAGDYSRLAHFSPEAYASSNVNQNLRYHPYNPIFRPFTSTVNRSHKSCHFYTDNGFYGPKTAENSFAVQRGHQQNTEIPSKTRNEIYDEKANYFRPNIKDKRQKLYEFKNAALKRKVSTQKVHKNLEVNYDSNIVRSYVPNESVLTNNDHENQLFSADGQCYLREEIIEAKNITRPAMNNSNRICDQNFKACPSKSLTDPLISNFDYEREGNTNTIFTDEITNTDKSNFHLVNEIDLLNSLLTNIIKPENINCDIQNTKQENLASADLENCLMRQIFIGKDENGQDIILLVDSDIEVSDVKSEFDLSVDIKNLETQNQQTITSNSAENTTLMGENSSDFQFTEQMNTTSNEPGENIFFSHIDNFAAEEVVLTSKDIYPKIETHEKANVMNADENDATNLKQISGNIYNISDFDQELSTLNESRNVVMGAVNVAEEKRCAASNFVPQSSTSKENRNTDGTIRNKVAPRKKIDFQGEEREFKKRFQFDCNEPLSNIQHAYTTYFMEKVKLENKPFFNSEVFWKMYRTIVHEVGSNVMQTMYRILPRLIEISKNSKEASKKPSKSNKKRLKVKIRANIKK